MTALLVTGGSGQLARALAKAAPAGLRVVGRPGFDFDAPETLDALFRDPPPVLINAAAWTDVDGAESNRAAAFRANAEGPARLAALCHRTGTKLIHISTDYVFGEAAVGPHAETAPTAPAGAYGHSKREGETAILAALPEAVVLRTAWVYAETGKNFVRTMLNAARRAPVLRVVADQRGCPTNADDLAAAVLAIAGRLTSATPPPGGIYHAAGSGDVTWHGFAQAIFAAAAPYGWPVPEVQPIATADWPTPARRPADSRLACTRLADIFGLTLPPWQQSLHRSVRRICTQGLLA